MLNGHADPLALLALDPDDLRLALEVVRRSERFRSEQRKHELDYLAEAIGVKVGNAVARLLS